MTLAGYIWILEFGNQKCQPRGSVASGVIEIPLAKKILVAVEDLFFRAKIWEAARLAGVAIEAVGLDALRAQTAQPDVAAIILDLNDKSGAAVEAVRALRAASCNAPLTIVGFASHVQSDLIRAAREAGCSQVLARSAFSRDLPRLLAELAQPSAEPC